MELLSTTATPCAEIGILVCDWDAVIDDLAVSLPSRHFTHVYLAIEERHTVYRTESVREAVIKLHAAGLKVSLVPWGMSGFTGYSTSHPYAIYNFLRLVARTECDQVYLGDMVKSYEGPVLSFARQISLSVPLVRAFDRYSISEYPSNPALFNANRMSYHFDASIVIHEHNILLKHCDTDQIRFTTELDRLLTELERMAGTFTDEVWITNTRVPANKEWMIAYQIAFWADHGYTININGWDALRTVSDIRSADWQTCWDVTQYAVKELSTKHNQDKPETVRFFGPNENGFRDVLEQAVSTKSPTRKEKK